MQPLQPLRDEPHAPNIRIVPHEPSGPEHRRVRPVVDGVSVRVVRAQRRDLFWRQPHTRVRSKGDWMRRGDDSCGACGWTA